MSDPATAAFASDELNGKGTDHASTATIPDHLTMTRLVRAINKLFGGCLQNRFGRENMPVGRWHFLTLLSEANGASQGELSRRAGIREPTTVVHLEKLEQRGLIRRVRHPKDRRRVHVYVTAKGRKLQKDLVKSAAEVNAIAVAGLNSEDVEVCRRILAMVIDNLTAHQERLVTGKPPPKKAGAHRPRRQGRR